MSKLLYVAVVLVSASDLVQSDPNGIHIQPILPLEHDRSESAQRAIVEELGKLEGKIDNFEARSRLPAAVGPEDSAAVQSAKALDAVEMEEERNEEDHIDSMNEKLHQAAEEGAESGTEIQSKDDEAKESVEKAMYHKSEIDASKKTNHIEKRLDEQDEDEDDDSEDRQALHDLNDEVTALRTSGAKSTELQADMEAAGGEAEGAISKAEGFETQIDAQRGKDIKHRSKRLKSEQSAEELTDQKNGKEDQKNGKEAKDLKGEGPPVITAVGDQPCPCIEESMVAPCPLVAKKTEKKGAPACEATKEAKKQIERIGKAIKASHKDKAATGGAHKETSFLARTKMHQDF